jgi:pimeloyl-ACP methyl ester carboxylesterase
MPTVTRWNGDVVVFAHGYVAFNEPVAIPEGQLGLPGGASLPELANALRFAFATTSYRANGLVVREGLEDVRDLVELFRAEHPEARRVYLVGVSEGGLITALAVERFPETFDGGIAACGPVEDFRRQLDHFGNFRVVFDYFYPGVIPGSAVAIPPEVIAGWDTIYAPRILAALRAQPATLDELLRVTRAPFDSAVPVTKELTVLGLLWYSVFATNDGVEKLGGQPFDNRHRFYFGSSNDFLLDLSVKRFAAEAAALNEVNANYQTTGHLSAPLVTLHTTGDPIVPVWHETLYFLKTLFSDAALQLLHTNLPVARYGHCQFQPDEAVAAFAWLVFQVQSRELTGIEAVLRDPLARERFRALSQGLRTRGRPNR